MGILAQSMRKKAQQTTEEYMESTPATVAQQQHVYFKQLSLEELIACIDACETPEQVAYLSSQITDEQRAQLEVLLARSKDEVDDYVAAKAEGDTTFAVVDETDEDMVSAPYEDEDDAATEAEDEAAALAAMFDFVDDDDEKTDTGVSDAADDSGYSVDSEFEDMFAEDEDATEQYPEDDTVASMFTEDDDPVPQDFEDDDTTTKVLDFTAIGKFALQQASAANATDFVQEETVTDNLNTEDFAAIEGIDNSAFEDGNITSADSTDADLSINDEEQDALLASIFDVADDENVETPSDVAFDGVDGTDIPSAEQSETVAEVENTSDAVDGFEDFPTFDSAEQVSETSEGITNEEQAAIDEGLTTDEHDDNVCNTDTESSLDLETESLDEEKEELNADVSVEPNNVETEIVTDATVADLKRQLLEAQLAYAELRNAVQQATRINAEQAQQIAQTQIETKQLMDIMQAPSVLPVTQKEKGEHKIKAVAHSAPPATMDEVRDEGKRRLKPRVPHIDAGITGIDPEALELTDEPVSSAKPKTGRLTMEERRRRDMQAENAAGEVVSTQSESLVGELFEKDWNLDMYFKRNKGNKEAFRKDVILHYFSSAMIDRAEMAGKVYWHKGYLKR